MYIVFLLLSFMLNDYEYRFSVFHAICLHNPITCVDDVVLVVVVVVFFFIFLYFLIWFFSLYITRTLSRSYILSSTTLKRQCNLKCISWKKKYVQNNATKNSKCLHTNEDCLTLSLGVKVNRPISIEVYYNETKRKKRN